MVISSVSFNVALKNNFFCLFLLQGLVNKFLSARFWIPLSRLTYCAYLVHPIIIFAMFQSFETVRAYSDVHMVSGSSSTS